MINIRTQEQQERDNYYQYLFKKYNCYDCYKLVDMITEEENAIREELELRVI